jgi:ubiquinone/menaquinone biosynthesis C-methylase UbiE
MSEKASPVENKGAVARASEKVQRSRDKTLVEIWDEKYVLHPTWWKGPYDISPVLRQVAPGADVLDVGCGSGRYLLALDRNGFRAVGADLSREALAPLDPQCMRVVADAQQLPFSDRSFDAVTCYGVLQHLTRGGRAKAVAELFRVLRPQGLAFVEVVGQLDMRYGRGKRIAADTFVRGDIPHHYFSQSELHELFQSAGFAVLTLDDKVARKQYDNVLRQRHRIFTTMAKT